MIRTKIFGKIYRPISAKISVPDSTPHFSHFTTTESKDRIIKIRRHAFLLISKSSTYVPFFLCPHCLSPSSHSIIITHLKHYGHVCWHAVGRSRRKQERYTHPSPKHKRHAHCIPPTHPFSSCTWNANASYTRKKRKIRKRYRPCNHPWSELMLGGIWKRYAKLNEGPCPPDAYLRSWEIVIPATPQTVLLPINHVHP